MFLCLKKIDLTLTFLQLIRKILLAICCKIDAQEKPKEKKKTKDNLFFVSFLSDGVYLNDTKIIDKKADLQIAVFKILMEKHIIGNLHSAPAGLNTYQISVALEKIGYQSFELEKHVRQSIYKIKKNISRKYGNCTGESILQSSKLSGAYKLAKNVVLICT